MAKSKVLSQNMTMLAIFLLGFVMWNLNAPTGLNDNAWHLLIIFLCTIIGVVLHPLPIGAVTSTGVLILILTNTLTLKETLSGFGDGSVWLIVFAFFISGGFINTGLGARIAYNLIYKFGRNTLGLAYSLVFTDFILSPSIPSVTARSGGIVFPIASALSNVFSDSETHKSRTHRNGGFFMAVCMQSSVITSGMFLTAMVANPVVVKLALAANVDISWADWAIAAFVPGILCLIFMPLVMYYYLYPPAIKTSDAAPKMAAKKLEEMGPITKQEIAMCLIFFMLIFLWIAGKKLFGVSAVTTALVGFIMLLLTRLIKFDEAMDNKTAWSTFIWFAHLTMMSSFLAKFGVMTWVEANLKVLLVGLSPLILIIALSLIYFYTHYFFASATAHVTVFFPAFLILFIQAGIPGKAAALMLGFLSIFSSGLTHFGIASAPIFFGPGYIKTHTWFKIGLITSFLYLVIWITSGSVWWKVIGLI